MDGQIAVSRQGISHRDGDRASHYGGGGSYADCPEDGSKGSRALSMFLEYLFDPLEPLRDTAARYAKQAGQAKSGADRENCEQPCEYPHCDVEYVVDRRILI